MQEIHLVVGVPCSGKSWVCEQLTSQFHYVRHDNHLADLVPTLVRTAQSSPRPVLVDCPFGERQLKSDLEAAGIRVHPYFIIEDPRTIQKRYLEDRRKPAPKNVVTRATTIRERAIEWRAPMGTSGEILKVLSLRGQSA